MFLKTPTYYSMSLIQNIHGTPHNSSFAKNQANPKQIKHWRKTVQEVQRQMKNDNDNYYTNHQHEWVIRDLFIPLKHQERSQIYQQI